MLLTASKECRKEVTKIILGEEKIKTGANKQTKTLQLIWQTNGDSLFLQKIKNIKEYKTISDVI